MSTENSPKSPNHVIQEGRTAFFENIIDDRLDQLHKLTDRLLAWPVPRPFVIARRKQVLRCLSWATSQLQDSRLQDELLQQATAEPLAITSLETDQLIDLQPTAQTLHNNAAAEAVVSVIEDR